MLERLRVIDLALVARTEVEFGPGLNAVTGETGAGKTLLVQSISLLVGERGDADTVREGASSAVVEGEFRLEGASARRAGELLAEWGIEFDGETLIIRREVQSGGKSRATVNQAAVTLASLKRLGDILVDLHGQHEHQSLLRPGMALEVLDRLGRLQLVRTAYVTALESWRSARSELERLEHGLSDLADRRDSMAETAREIDEMRLVAGEEEDLAREAARLAHADRLRELVGLAIDRLSEGEGSAHDALREALHALEQGAALDGTLSDSMPALAEARIATQETARALSAYAAGLEADPRALEEVEARRDRIARLGRKYRRDVPGLIAWREELRRDLAMGEDAEGALRSARALADAGEQECRTLGSTLSMKRQAAAAEWSGRITRELKPLGMNRARLEFVLEPEVVEPGKLPPLHGLDRVELRFTANPGEPPRPLQRIASGGELSRVMLALKTALEAQDRVDLLVFDEVDSGVGGAVAQAVGERLRRLARHRQIVCVTHLPMIAALATHHLRVSKHVAGRRTSVIIEQLEDQARVEELARMLAGDLATDTTRRQARELLAHAPAESHGAAER